MKYRDLTDVERRALDHLAKSGPQLPSELGCALWPDTASRRKPQTLARSAGKVLGRLRELGLVEEQHGTAAGDGRRFWRLTPAGDAAVEHARRAASDASRAEEARVLIRLFSASEGAKGPDVADFAGMASFFAKLATPKRRVANDGPTRMLIGQMVTDMRLMGSARGLAWVELVRIYCGMAREEWKRGGGEAEKRASVTARLFDSLDRAVDLLARRLREGARRS